MVIKNSVLQFIHKIYIELYRNYFRYHTRQSEDTARKQQQQHIDKLVAYIDERAAYYSKSRPTFSTSVVPELDVKTSTRI